MRHINNFSLKNNQGQAILLVFLIVAIGLSIGAAIFLNSLREYRSASYSTQYSQAGSAAEAGVEEGLGNESSLTSIFQVTPVPSVTGTLTTGKYTAQMSSEGVSQYVTAKVIDENEVLEIRVGDINYGDPEPTPTVVYTYDDAIDLYWNDEASIEVRIYKVNYEEGRVLLRKDIYDCSGGAGSIMIGGSTVNFDCTASVDMEVVANVSADEILRVRPIGGGTKLGFTTASALPVAQVVKVQSIGESGQSQVKIKEEATRSFLPPIFDYLMFSGGDISK